MVIRLFLKEKFYCILNNYVMFFYLFSFMEKTILSLKKQQVNQVFQHNSVWLKVCCQLYFNRSRKYFFVDLFTIRILWIFNKNWSKTFALNFYSWLVLKLIYCILNWASFKKYILFPMVWHLKSATVTASF